MNELQISFCTIVICGSIFVFQKKLAHSKDEDIDTGVLLSSAGTWQAFLVD
jgi:hypothetical protein